VFNARLICVLFVGNLLLMFTIKISLFSRLLVMKWQPSVIQPYHHLDMSLHFQILLSTFELGKFVLLRTDSYFFNILFWEQLKKIQPYNLRNLIQFKVSHSNKNYIVPLVAFFAQGRYEAIPDFWVFESVFGSIIFLGL
jgi:hypothetical protein